MTQRVIDRVVVANRGEIASRVFRTCRRLGIETIAVHSEADARLPFVREADHAHLLPGNTPAETYLQMNRIIDVARGLGGCVAIHPGYGFLSENAEFAAAVIGAGLVWVGPDPDSIERMGSKIEAKKLMEAAGVPVLSAPAEPTDGDLPLLVKASAGGGGRGMRVVRILSDLPGEVAAARAEAESAFGDGTVFVEPYVEHGRHVEVQVVGDGSGGVLVLGERDCSVQRRHQKIIEEAPAPGLSDEVRTALHEAARSAAAAISYRGAGTVEFLYDPASERFWFLEMNTRLQVEHPVTEAVFGVDLVELQLAVAEGRPLPEPAAPVGHAVEVRLYAEDPAADYRPQTGVLTAFDLPGSTIAVRVDAGYESGSTVSTYYDAMLAKVIAHGDTREQATRVLRGALRRARIHGLVTNRDQLLGILDSKEFRSGEVSTSLAAESASVARDRSSVQQNEGVPGRAAPTAAAIAIAERTRLVRRVQHGIPVGWRNVTSQPQRTVFEVLGRARPDPVEVTVEWYGGRDGYVVDGHTMVGVSLMSADRDTDCGTDRWAVTLETDGLRTTYDVTVAGDKVDIDSPYGHTSLRTVPRFADPAGRVAAGSLVAPMPGTVVKVLARPGQHVTQGRPILVLEAMKMQHTVSAPADGVVTEVDVEAGQQVAAGQVLAVVDEADEADEADEGEDA